MRGVWYPIGLQEVTTVSKNLEIKLSSMHLSAVMLKVGQCIWSVNSYMITVIGSHHIHVNVDLIYFVSLTEFPYTGLGCETARLCITIITTSWIKSQKKLFHANVLCNDERKGLNWFMAGSYTRTPWYRRKQLFSSGNKLVCFCIYDTAGCSPAISIYEQPAVKPSANLQYLLVIVEFVAEKWAMQK